MGVPTACSTRVSQGGVLRLEQFQSLASVKRSFGGVADGSLTPNLYQNLPPAVFRHEDSEPAIAELMSFGMAGTRMIKVAEAGRTAILQIVSKTVVNRTVSDSTS